MVLLRYGMSTFHVHVYDILRPCTTDLYKHLHIIASLFSVQSTVNFTRCMTCILCSIIIWVFFLPDATTDLPDLLA